LSCVDVLAHSGKALVSFFAFTGRLRSGGSSSSSLDSIGAG
jgi:hypothetical protein